MCRFYLSSATCCADAGLGAMRVQEFSDDAYHLGCLAVSGIVRLCGRQA
jgi:hypothetical protein